MLSLCLYSFFFFFNDTATTEIYTLPLHDALPICMLDDDRRRRLEARHRRQGGVQVEQIVEAELFTVQEARARHGGHRGLCLCRWRRLAIVSMRLVVDQSRALAPPAGTPTVRLRLLPPPHHRPHP